MCGRFALRSSPEEIRRLFGYGEQPNFPPRYNIAPTQPVPVIFAEHGVRHFRLMRWGLIPSWVKDPKQFSLLINARLESVNDKPSFRGAMKYRRCLVPADGFYEWQKTGGAKRPFFIRARVGSAEMEAQSDSISAVNPSRTNTDGKPFAFAALWETWTDRDGGEIDTAAIITCAANRMIAPIHDRMPVVVPPDLAEAWLDCDRVDAKQAAALLGRAPDDFFEAYEISPRVNSVKNDSPENITRAA